MLWRSFLRGIFLCLGSLKRTQQCTERNWYFPKRECRHPPTNDDHYWKLNRSEWSLKNLASQVVILHEAAVYNVVELENSFWLTNMLPTYEPTSTNQPLGFCHGQPEGWSPAWELPPNVTDQRNKTDLGQPRFMRLDWPSLHLWHRKRWADSVVSVCAQNGSWMSEEKKNFFKPPWLLTP